MALSEHPCVRVSVTQPTSADFLKEMNNLIQQGGIKLTKGDSTVIYDVTEDFYFKKMFEMFIKSSY